PHQHPVPGPVPARPALRLDGSTAFDGEKTFYINQTQMPRVGDVWPAWYDRDDPSTFGVGQPDLSSPEAQQTLREFGIANPLDGGAPAEDPAPAQADAGDRDDRIVAIEQLGDLRARGLLTDAEFEAEKRRLLES
ncbi:MAG: SHOCT domain-containing protein, partial [Actinomycetota bacterium]